MDIFKRAKIMSETLRIGEPIRFGSDADLIDELVQEVKRLRNEADGPRALANALESGQIKNEIIRSSYVEKN